MAENIDNQCCQLFNKKLSDQPKIFLFFSPKLFYGWQIFPNLMTTCKKSKKIKFTKSWKITLNIRAIRGVRTPHSGSCKVCTRMYVYLHIIKSLKRHIRYADSFSFYFATVLLFLTLGAARQSCWPSLGGGSKRLSSTDRHRQILFRTDKGDCPRKISPLFS
jgi:hypothetical protein